MGIVTVSVTKGLHKHTNMDENISSEFPNMHHLEPKYTELYTYNLNNIVVSLTYISLSVTELSVLLVNHIYFNI